MRKYYKLGLLLLIIFGLIAIIKFDNSVEPINRPTPNSTLEIYFLNVSQGDAIFFRTSNYTMLVDCGNKDKGKEVSNYLMDKLGVYKLDYLIITHTDSDHIGGCPFLLSSLYVKKVLMDGQKRNTTSYNSTIVAIGNASLIISRKYEDYEFGSAVFRILHANTGSTEPNQNSIVLILYFGNFSILMDADCDLECENDLIGQNIRAEVLKVAHHGSKYATSDEFLEKVKPKLAVIEVGKNNYGHPANETLGRLQNANVQVLRTDLNGTIILITNGAGYTIRSG